MTEITSQLRWGVAAAKQLLELPLVLTGNLAQKAQLVALQHRDGKTVTVEHAVPGRAAQQIRDTLEFPPGTAGHMMDAGVVTFRDETTIEAAFSRIRQLRRRVADVLLCDDEGRLTGVVPLQELVGLPLDTSLGRYARRSFATVHAMASRDEVVELLSRHRLASLPVVDLDNRLLGTIRYGELVLAAQEAAADDLQTMVGAGREERGLSSPLFTVKSRLPWLLINLMTSFAAAAVVGIFDATIARYTALAVLLPIVAGQSGNTGAQALAVTCRALALREIRARHWPPLLFKEASASFANGVVVAVVTAVANGWLVGIFRVLGIFGGLGVRCRSTSVAITGLTVQVEGFGNAAGWVANVKAELDLPTFRQAGVPEQVRDSNVLPVLLMTYVENGVDLLLAGKAPAELPAVYFRAVVGELDPVNRAGLPAVLNLIIDLTQRVGDCRAGECTAA